MIAVYTKATTVRHEWRLSGAEFGGHGVPVVEVQKAIVWAKQEYEKVFGRAPQHDDWLKVWASDEEIVLWFESPYPDRLEGERGPNVAVGGAA